MSRILDVTLQPVDETEWDVRFQGDLGELYSITSRYGWESDHLIARSRICTVISLEQQLC